MTFPSSTTSDGDSQCITIDIVDDDTYEEDQHFMVEIKSVAPTTSATVGSLNSASVTIQDNNGLCYYT